MFELRKFPIKVITLAAVMADVDEAGVVGGVIIGSSVTIQHNHQPLIIVILRSYIPILICIDVTPSTILFI